MKAIQYAEKALRLLYPHESTLFGPLHAAYDDVMCRHYKGTLDMYREERRQRVCGVDNANLPELSKLLGSYIGNHREPLTSWKEDFEKLYHEIEKCNAKEITSPDNFLSFDQIVSIVVSSLYGLPVPYSGFLHTRKEFGDIKYPTGSYSYVYAHTHFALDNRMTGQSLVNLLKSPSATEIYRNIFRIDPDGNYNRVMHATATPDDRTLVSGHTLWHVKEEHPFYVERPGMAPTMIIPRTFCFVDYNSRLKYDKESAVGKLCRTTTEFKHRIVE